MPRQRLFSKLATSILLATSIFHAAEGQVVSLLSIPQFRL